MIVDSIDIGRASKLCGKSADRDARLIQTTIPVESGDFRLYAVGEKGKLFHMIKSLTLTATVPRIGGVLLLKG